jgi:hypothetical protein
LMGAVLIGTPLVTEPRPSMDASVPWNMAVKAMLSPGLTLDLDAVKLCMTGAACTLIVHDCVTRSPHLSGLVPIVKDAFVFAALAGGVHVTARPETVAPGGTCTASMPLQIDGTGTGTGNTGTRQEYVASATYTYW